MNTNHPQIAKVLVLDDAYTQFESLKSFYVESGLLGIRPQRGDEESVVALLKSNVDLGGIMLHEGFGGGTANALSLARRIHDSRPELPMFLRRDQIPSLAGIGEKDAAMFRCAYTMSDLGGLPASLDASIFSRIYPNELVRGITEFTRASLQTLFRDCDVDIETPYLVKDRIIYGEVFTMISIESDWCRGYMMLQASEAALLRLIGGETRSVTFRELNNVLGEATNLIWGSFKNRYSSTRGEAKPSMQTQVPIVINHQRSYISFGSDDPQLCLKYTLRKQGQPDAAPVPIFQRFVFNLSWAPDQFKENPSVESLVSLGELEMF